MTARPAGELDPFRHWVPCACGIFRPRGEIYPCRFCGFLCCPACAHATDSWNSTCSPECSAALDAAARLGGLT